MVPRTAPCVTVRPHSGQRAWSGGRRQAPTGTCVAGPACAALAELREGDNVDRNLPMVGGASGAQGEKELQICRDLVAKHQLAERVRFFEPQPHSTLADHYRAADVLIVPSYSESFGLVAAEAQACGTPVVASNIGGLPYVVSAAESGLLVDNHDVRAFATALSSIVDYASFAERLYNGAVACSQRITCEETTIRLLDLY